MKIYQFFHGIIEKFIPLDESSKAELQTEAVNFYNSNLEKAKEVERINNDAVKYNVEHSKDENFVPKNLVQIPMSVKIIAWLNTWWVRYLIAAAFIFAVPKIKNYIYQKNEDSEEYEDDDFDDDDDDDLDDFEEYKKYLRIKKQMR